MSDIMDQAEWAQEKNRGELEILQAMADSLREMAFALEGSNRALETVAQRELYISKLRSKLPVLAGYNPRPKDF